MRVPLIVLALVATPLAIGAAQGQSNGNASPTAAANRCKNTPQAGVNGNSQAGAAAVAQAQADKCPPPPPSGPPSGLNGTKGMVYEDIDGNGSRDPFAGEMGLAGWTVQLIWNGQVIATTTSDVDGSFQFGGLGNATYNVCVVLQAGYMQTAPTAGSACDGLGYETSFSGSFPSWWENINFGMMLNP